MSSSRAFTLHQTGLMNSVSERAFDNIAYLAKLIFNTDIVFFNSGAFRGNTSYPAGPVTETNGWMWSLNES